MAPRRGPRPAVGAISTSRIVTAELAELYDYASLRLLVETTMLVIAVPRPVVVMGGNQSTVVLDHDGVEHLTLRRRRGGGGMVLLQPGDLWVDWWIPANDSRWSQDVRATSIRAGSWWQETLQESGITQVSVHTGPLEGNPEHRVVCFAGSGPGEVFVQGRKTVGITQWRVREGAFLSSVLHAGPTFSLLSTLAHIPVGLRSALDHQTMSTLELSDTRELIGLLEHASEPQVVRHLELAL